MPNVRPAQLGDLFWLRLLLGQLIQEEGKYAYPQTTPRDLESLTAGLAARLASADPSLLCFVAEQEEVCVGFVLGDMLTRIGEPRCYASIIYLYMVPGWRLQGTGQDISRAVITEAKARGAEALEFLTRPGDSQWAARGWPTVATVCALPIDAALASVVSSRVPNGHHTSEVPDETPTA